MSAPGIVRFLGASAVTLTIALGAISARADTVALVIGIDDYEHIGKLQGATNDALDIADALRTAGARRIITLLDHAADRDGVMRAWRELIADTGPDDTLIFSYAGHGGQEPERVPGNEADGMDETFLLAGFSNTGPGTYQRIIDDEVAQMLRAAEPRRVILVADSCHSGTMTRGIDKRVHGLPTRNAKYGAIEDDELPPPSREAAGAELNPASNVVFFGAVSEHELAPEVRIDGKPRGALSWSFARALRGDGDQNHDGVITKDELERFIRESVRMKMEGRQHPQVQPQGLSRAPLLPVAKTAGAATFDKLPDPRPLALGWLGGDEGAKIAAALTVITPTPDSDKARLSIDTRTGEMLTALGDVAGTIDINAPVAQRVAAAQAMVDKWVLIDRLERVADLGGLTLSLSPGEKRHLAGAKVRLSIEGHTLDHLTLINLAAGGEMNFVYPLRNADFNDPPQVPLGRPYTLDLEIEKPFGADHFVAIFSREPLEGLHQALRDRDGQAVGRILGDLLDQHLAGKPVQIGWHQIFSAPLAP